MIQEVSTQAHLQLCPQTHFLFLGRPTHFDPLELLRYFQEGFALGLRQNKDPIQSSSKTHTRKQQKAERFQLGLWKVRVVREYNRQWKEREREIKRENSMEVVTVISSTPRKAIQQAVKKMAFFPSPLKKVYESAFKHFHS